MLVIGRLTEPVPEDRFSSAQEAQRALAAVRAGERDVPVPSDSLAAIVETERRARQQAAIVHQHQEELAKRKARERLDRMRSRVEITRGSSGLRILVRAMSLADLYTHNFMELVFIPLLLGGMITFFIVVANGNWIWALPVLLVIATFALVFVRLSHRRYVFDVAPTGHFAIDQFSPRRADIP